MPKPKLVPIDFRHLIMETTYKSMLINSLYFGNKAEISYVHYQMYVQYFLAETS